MSDLDFYFDDDVFKSTEYERYSNSYKRMVRGGIGNISIFTPEMYYILSTPINGFDRVNKKRTLSNPDEYFKIYKEAYIKGQEYFRQTFLTFDINSTPIHKHFALKIDRLYNTDGLITGGKNKGWNFVRTTIPFTITSEVLKKHGYYSGIVEEVELFHHQNKEGFIEYLPIKEAEKQNSNYSKVNKFNSISIDKVSKHFEYLVKNKHLSNEDLERFIDLAFCKCEPITEKFTLSNLANKKGKIKSLFGAFFQKSNDHGQGMRYAKLLADYFEGFKEDNVYQNMNK